MRLVIYNLRYCTGTGGKLHLPWSGYLRRTEKHLEKVIAFLKPKSPDIIGLLEVDAGSYRAGKKNQALEIAKALGFKTMFSSKYNPPSMARKLPLFSKHINAILCNKEIKNQHFHYFAKGIKRLVIELELSSFVLFLVHLSLTFRTRQNQLCDLFTLVKRAKKPCIVAGDFNAFFGKNELKLFLAATGLKNANNENIPTFPSWAPKKELDFILYSNGIEVRNFKIVHTSLSDHLPLICDFEAGIQQSNAT
jgi:endonuclease/exonuclease/phosphatase family metal-dependent hydrolase